MLKILAAQRWSVRMPRVLLVACVVLPWLNPAAGGPSAVVQPWLTSAAATLLLWILVAPQVTRRNMVFALLGAALLALVGEGSPAVLLAIGGLAVIAGSAAVAADGDHQAGPALADAWLIAALVSSLFALTQYFGLASHFAPWVNATEPGEAFANLRQRNQFATLTSIGLVALLWKIQQGSRVLRWAFPAAALLAAANAASASRTGAVQIVVVAVLTVLWVRPPKRGVVGACIVAVAAYTAAAVLLPQLLQSGWGVSSPNAFSRLSSNEGCGSRGVLWSNVLLLISQKPWGGWGWGELDYAHFATLYPGARFCDILDNAHNLPLHLAVELGVPAAMLVCGAFLWWVARQQPWREADGTRQLAWLVIAVVLVHSLLEYPLWYGPFQMAFGFSLGLLARPQAGSQVPLAGRAAILALGAALGLALLFAAWDYHRISQLYMPEEERSALYRGQPLPRTGDSWLFRDQLSFAELSVTAVSRENAARVNPLALELLHYSPEPRVIESAIESAVALGRDDMALWLLARYHAAFPKEARTAFPPRPSKPD